jgi:predicted glycosyltransferase
MSTPFDLPGSARLLIYSQDGLGLGHLRRTSLLAGAFLDALPGSSVLTISDSPAGHFFDTRSGHDHLKLPSIRKIGPGDWSPVSLGMAFGEVLKIRQEAIRGAALAFEPDLLLVDHMPHGAMGELVPTLRALEGLRTRVVLGLRDILDAPATIRRRWRLEGAFEAVERHFDDVLVYGSRDIFDVAAQYGWPPGLSSRVHYCGYVCAPATRTDAEAVRRRYLRHRPGGRLVVVMAGGGADAYALFDTLVRAVPMLQTGRPCAVVIVTGPFLPGSERARLRRLAKGLPVHMVSTVHNATGYLAAADVVVSMAGYNTTAEILSVGVPALLVPRAGPSAEQQIRAGRFADRGWVDWIPPDALTPTTLAASMRALLDGRVQRPAHAQRPDLRGRQRAAARLLQVLAGAEESGTGAELALSTATGTGTDMIPLRGGD